MTEKAVTPEQIAALQDSRCRMRFAEPARVWAEPVKGAPDPFWQGWEAREAGAMVTSNPFPRESRENFSWARGWITADQCQAGSVS